MRSQSISLKKIMKHTTLTLVENRGSGFNKIESNSMDLSWCSKGGDNPMAVTIKVSEAGYVPSCINVRTKISPNLFTAKVAAKDLYLLENDTKVVSFGTPKHLHQAS